MKHQFVAIARLDNFACRPGRQEYANTNLFDSFLSVSGPILGLREDLSAGVKEPPALELKPNCLAGRNSPCALRTVGAERVQRTSTVPRNSVIWLPFFLLLISGTTKTLAAEKPTVYVWDFSTREGGVSSLTRSLTEEFEEALSKSNCCVILQRRFYSRLFAQKKNEEGVMSLRELSSSRLDNLRLLEAKAVVFGEVYDDIDGGQLKITVTIESFDSTIQEKESIAFLRGKQMDPESRQEAMTQLTAKLFNSARYGNVEEPPAFIITEEDKIIFTLGASFGGFSAKILYRFSFETVSLPEVGKLIFTELLDMVDYPTSRELTERKADILLRANEIETAEERFLLLVELMGLKNSVQEHIASHYGEKETYIYHLGFVLTPLHRLLTEFKAYEEWSAADDRIVTPELVTQVHLLLVDLCSPSLHGLRQVLTASEYVFPPTIRARLNTVLVSDIRQAEDRERALEAIADVGFEFGYIYKKHLEVSGGQSFQTSSWALGAAQEMMAEEDYTSAIKLLTELGDQPAAHFLLAKAYAVRFLIDPNYRIPQFDTATVVRLLIERYLTFDNRSKEYEKEARLLLEVTKQLPETRVARPGHISYEFSSASDQAYQEKRDLEFLRLLEETEIR